MCRYMRVLYKRDLSVLEIESLYYVLRDFGAVPLCYIPYHVLSYNAWRVSSTGPYRRSSARYVKEEEFR